MDYEALVSKIASSQLPVNPRLNDVMNKVRAQGLHKAASHMYGLDEVTLKTATTHLGTALLASAYRRKKIAESLDALDFVYGEKNAGLFDAFKKLPNLVAKKAPAAAVSPAMPAIKGKGLAGLEAMGKVDPTYNPNAKQVWDTAMQRGKARVQAEQAAKALQAQQAHIQSLPRVTPTTTPVAEAPTAYEKYLQGDPVKQQAAATRRAQMFGQKG